VYGRPQHLQRGRRRWNWLLAIPIVMVLPTPLYNRTEPHLFGIAFFYWYQFALVILTNCVIAAVYQLTKPGRRH
jgi:hypothetical protein